MNYGAIKDCDIANGPGVRVSLFVSGCTHHCKDCFQPETWNFQYGKPFTQDTAEALLALLSPDYICGITILGGEPFEPQNQPEVLRLLRQIKSRYPQKSIWAYTGYTLETDLLTDRLGMPEITREILSLLDVLVDGEFKTELKNLRLKFRGSENQRLIDLPKTLKNHGTVVLWDEKGSL